MKLPLGALAGALVGVLIGAAAVAAVALGPLRVLSFFLMPTAAASVLAGGGLVVAGVYLLNQGEGMGQRLITVGMMLAVQFLTPLMAAGAGTWLVSQAQDYCEAMGEGETGLAEPLLALPASSGRYPLTAEFDEDGSGRCSFADPYGVRSAWIGERSPGGWGWENLMD